MFFGILPKGCICSNKDKNFKANHNQVSLMSNYLRVVSVVTKIRILKQITTVSFIVYYCNTLYL